MPGLYTGANGLWGGFAGLLYGSTSLSTPPGLLADAAAGYSPASLFANGEQGVWLDNSDFTTLFQDAAGTTPVTGYEQFVGLRLDKSKSGVGTNGAKRVNLLSWTEQFDNAYWTKSSVAISSNIAVAPNGTLTADLMYPTGSGSFRSAYNSNSLVGGRVLKVRAKAAGLSWLWFINGPGNTVAAWFNLSTGVKGTVIAGYTHDMQPLGDGWYECTMTSASADIIFAQFGVSDTDNSSTVTASGTNGVYLWGADMRTVANSTIEPLYQRITDTWYNTIPGNHAYQTNINARAVLSARYNLLTHTEQFDNAAWTKSSLGSINPTVTTGVSDPLGGSSACRISIGAVTSSSNFSIVYQSYTPQALTYTTALYLRASTASDIGKTVYLVFGAGLNYVGFTLTSSWQRVTTNFAVSASATAFAFGSVGSNYGGTNQAAFSVDVWGADLRVANESSALPAYQRVGAAVNGTSTSIGTPDYDTVGFPAYLRYDGGDWYQTNSIDFSTGATNPPTTGAELVSNPGPFTTTTGYTESVTGGITVSAGNLRTTRTSIGSIGYFGPLTTVVGKLYKFTAPKNTISGDVGAFKSDSPTGNTNPVYTENGCFIATSTATYIRFYANAANSVVDYSLISVKEVADANYAPDKMSVFTGVRKLDTADSAIAELSVASSGNTGTFAFFANNSGNSNYFFRSHGTISSSVITPNTYPAPITNVLTGLGNISADDNTIRVNGLQVAQSTADQGTGTFGNYPLYLGARGGGSLFFNGREYETIILGRAVTATELANTEGYMEAQTFGKDMAYVYSDELTTATGDFITAADGDQIYMTVTYQ